MQNKRYRIPKNLCQICYSQTGRYILDCYCIICQQCYKKAPKKQSICSICNKQTHGNKIDTKMQSSIKKIAYLFDHVDINLQKILQIYKFQYQISNRYCQHLQQQLIQYQNAVNQLININKNLYHFFNARVKLKPYHLSPQQNNNHHKNAKINHIKHEPTINNNHNNRQYTSQIYQSRRTTLDTSHQKINQQHQLSINGVKAIKRNSSNQSGNIVYKVPNINYNTAIRSSKRISKDNHKIQNQYDQDFQYYRKRKPHT